MNKIISVTRNTTYFITLAFLALTLCRCNLAKNSAKEAPEDVAAAEVAVVATEVGMPSSATADQSSGTHIATLPTPALQTILSYTDAATCVATYQLSRSYLEGLELWDKALARDRLLVPKVLGNNFVATKAWQALDVEVPALPELSPALIAEVKRLHQLRQQPLLVLDLGKSIAELEALCKAQGLSVFKADGDDEKLRAEDCYQAPGTDCPCWFLVPGSDHGVLPGSRNKRYDEQVSYMEQSYPGYVVGRIRSLVTLAMLKYLHDGTMLLSENPSKIYGRCKEQYQQGNWQNRRICISTNTKDTNRGLSLFVDFYDYDIVYPCLGLFCYVVDRI